jgi:hypothetical protein
MLADFEGKGWCVRTVDCCQGSMAQIFHAKSRVVLLSAQGQTTRIDTGI